MKWLHRLYNENYLLNKLYLSKGWINGNGMIKWILNFDWLLKQGRRIRIVHCIPIGKRLTSLVTGLKYWFKFFLLLVHGKKGLMGVMVITKSQTHLLIVKVSQNSSMRSFCHIRHSLVTELDQLRWLNKSYVFHVLLDQEKWHCAYLHVKEEMYFWIKLEYSLKHFRLNYFP